ncbi:hypothetical protein O988_05225, partial [Pseudogymnoascus sp. VKM F-3808]
MEEWAIGGYTSYEYPNPLYNWAQKDLTIRVQQENPMLAPILESSKLQLELEAEDLIDPRLRQAPEPGIELRAQELKIELSGSRLNSELRSGSELNSELGIELRAPARTRAKIRARARARAQVRAELQL